MNLKYALTGVAIVAASQVSYAQYSSDAFRFSQTNNGGTSRIKAIGGASTAVGGDLSNISSNPAGLGFFTRSEFSITPELDNSQVKSSYFGTAANSDKTQVNLSNASVVFYNQLATPRGRDKTKGWLSFNFGASYNRTNNFYRTENYSGQNPNGSITDYYAQLANQELNTYGNNAAGTLQATAYNQNLFDYSNTAQAFVSNVVSSTLQTNHVTTSGGQSEINLSGGANYSNKLYVGIGIGITNLRYNMDRTFSESGTANILINNVYTNSLYSSQYYQSQATTGSGFNAKIGVIYKPVEAVRLGATFTTPTYMTVTDSYLEGINTLYKSDPPAYQSNPSEYDLTYTLRTPLKASGGAAVFLGNHGFISGDLEYVDYKGMHLSGDYDATGDNNDLRNLYRSTVNARIGAEAKLEDFFIRGGFNYQGNPQVGLGAPIYTSSAGLGYRFGKYYLDATYQYVSHDIRSYAYELDPAYTANAVSPYANLKNAYNNAYLTFGFRF